MDHEYVYVLVLSNPGSIECIKSIHATLHGALLAVPNTTNYDGKTTWVPLQDCENVFFNSKFEGLHLSVEKMELLP